MRVSPYTRQREVHVGTIVVGVDGSPESKNALRWAGEEARLRGASVRAIHVYDDPILRWEAYGPPEGAMFTSEQFAELEEGLRSRAAEVQGQAEALVERAVAELGAIDDVKVDTVALRGRPASTLIEESKDADLLVVGSRGHGGFKELVLGSVSHQCAQHAVCPIVILPNLR
jgi:nucleotide-binding universal stress UspA family protein